MEIESELRSPRSRRSSLNQNVDVLAKLQKIPLTEFAAIGMHVPSGPREIALNLYAPCEKIYRERMGTQPLALMDFMSIWLTRNVPRDRNKCAFLTVDSGHHQFDRF